MCSGFQIINSNNWSHIDGTTASRLFFSCLYLQLLATVSAAFIPITSLGEVVQVQRNQSELDLIGGSTFFKSHVSALFSCAPLLTFLSLTGCRGRTVSRQAEGGGIRVLQTAGRRERSPPDIHPPLPLGQEVQPTTPDLASAQPGSSGWR